MMIITKLLIVSFMLLLGLTTGIVSNQNPTTPTPAPSKTPSPTPTLPAPQTAPTHSLTPAKAPPFKYTQNDLSVLTGNVQRPNGIAWYNDKLYVGCSGDWTIYELDARTGATKTYIYGVKNEHTLYVEGTPDDEINLWIPDYETNSLLHVTRDRAPAVVVSQLKGPWGITYFDSEHFLVTNLLGNNIVLISRDGEVTGVSSGLRSPTGITSDADYVYVANNGSSKRAIEWIKRGDINASVADANSAATHPLVTGIQNVTDVAIGKDGYLYFAYALGTRGVVGRVSPQQCRADNGCTNEQVEIVVYTELAAPLAGLTVSPDMRLYVHTIFKPEIYWVQLKS
jgi:glucose/arabinose dehydrogenase